MTEIGTTAMVIIMFSQRTRAVPEMVSPSGSIMARRHRRAG